MFCFLLFFFSPSLSPYKQKEREDNYLEANLPFLNTHEQPLSYRLFPAKPPPLEINITNVRAAAGLELQDSQL